ncbi:DUF2085 domain-containing protein [Methanobrevibacter curvatus]|uniref:DUF2085 domain-containing protein n=1 Tax=Methanobrevibacter curvatus TaxID=49547 RepID=A0A165ZGV9_9EURY|nr:DUF2085 domain-containing protein [Methanobrevibacter curvatus]KZX10699.1 hypothetical protein MBCUR_16920 [Methanobrevibacter curvatus]
MNFLNLICHRKKERTLKLKGHYFPVCARCTGFYISIVFYTVLAMFVPVKYTFNSTLLAVLLLIPCTIDGFTQLFEYRKSNNSLRLITGLIGGLGLMIIFKTLKFMFIY